MKTIHNTCSTKFTFGILNRNSFRNIEFTIMLLLFTAISSVTAVSQTASQQIIRLKVSNGIISDETIILFMPNATDGFDYYDSPKMMNNNDSIPEIYTMIGNEEIVINSMPPLTANKEISLAFKTGIAGTFTITNNQFENFPAGTTVKIINNLNQDVQIVSDGSIYSFTSNPITKSDMFTIKIELPDTTVVITDPEPDPNTDPNTEPNTEPDITFTVNSNNRIVITCNEEITKGSIIAIYNTMTGRLSFSGRLRNPITVINKKLPAGIYTVLVNNGGIITTGSVIVSNT